MGGKGKAPPPPDYAGAAQVQGEISKENLANQNFANRPTQITPFGTTTWETQAAVDPSTGQPVTSWTQRTSLAPELQSALNSQLNLQQGRSDLANSFMGRVASEYATPFDYSNLPAATAPAQPGSLTTSTRDYTPQLRTGVSSQPVVGGFASNAPQMGVSSMINSLRRSTPTTPITTSFNSRENEVQRSVNTPQLNTRFDPMTGRLVDTVNTERLQRQLNMADNPALPQFDSSYRDTVANQLMQRMQPVHERQSAALETQLANQGFTVGSEGFKRAMDELQQRQAAERFNALDNAGNEAQRLFNMGLSSRQQAFNEDIGSGQFVNQAANQAFQQNLTANQFRNQAVAQAYQQAMGAQQAGNQALGQQFQQNLAAGQFGNQATNQAFQQGLAATQAANQAQGQRFQQGLAANQFANQAIGQGYQQNLGAAQFGNQAQQQLFGQNMGLADLANRASGQAFQQDLAGAQFQNQALGQSQALDLARMQAGNQAMQQQFGMNQQYADSMNRLRQQAIAEQMQRRGMSLNEMNALLSGQQVQMPNMPSFQASGRAETPNLLGAMGQTYDAQMGAYNAEQAANANMVGGLFQLAGAAAPFMFSDRRLKRNIKRVGTHPIGVGVYEYTIHGYPQVGVIAQEVQKVRPDLVERHANGYLMVNYGGLL